MPYHSMIEVAVQCPNWSLYTPTVRMRRPMYRLTCHQPMVIGFSAVITPSRLIRHLRFHGMKPALRLPTHGKCKWMETVVSVPVLCSPSPRGLTRVLSAARRSHSQATSVQAKNSTGAYAVFQRAVKLACGQLAPVLSFLIWMYTRWIQTHTRSTWVMGTFCLTVVCHYSQIHGFLGHPQV